MMLFWVAVTMLIFCVNCILGNDCPNTTRSAFRNEVCLFSNITLQCHGAILSGVNGSQLGIEWTIYPHNTSINSSSILYSNDTSSTTFEISRENVFFLITQNGTSGGTTANCLLCNISLDISQSTNALINATQSYIKVDDNQSLMNITTEDLGGFVTSDQLSVGNPNTLHTVGECETAIRYAECLLKPESFAWYLNGTRIRNANFTIDENGRLTFTNAQESHAGLYLCVITLPGEFGSFITTARELKLSTTETQVPVEQDDNNGTPTWAIVLIIAVSLIITVILIIISVFVQIKVGFWCCYGRFAIKPQVPRSQTQQSIANKSEFLVHQSSKDRLLNEPTQKPKLLRMSSKKSRSGTSSSKRGSLIKDKWECEYRCILFEEVLYQGTFKKIERAIIGTHSVVVKTLKNKESELGLDELMHETSIQKHIARISNYFEHPNVIGLYGACTMDPSSPYCLILEYMEHGTLDKLLMSLRSGPLPEWYIAYLKQYATLKLTYAEFVSTELMEIIKQIVSAMIFLNRHGILHRDLSTRNVFIGDNLLVKVGNFGMTHEGRYYIVTERSHYLQDMAPECLHEKKFSVKSDIWSFGIFLYKICSLETNPYPKVNPSDLYKKLKSGMRAKMPSTCSEELYILMQRCWKSVPIERPTFTALQKYFNDYKYITSNSIFFKFEEDQEQSDCTVEADNIYLYQPPSEITELFDRSGVSWDRNVQLQDRWSNDEIYNTMRTVDTELPSEQSSSESHEERIVQDSQMRNEHKPRDRRQKRSLVYPAMAAFTRTTSTSHPPGQQQRQQGLADKTDGPGRERYTPHSNSASKMFKSDPLNMYLEPAYKELLIPSESETSVDTDSIINTDSLPHNHKQGGYRYAYP